MRSNQFTQSAQSALRLAQSTAGELGHSYVGSEHILIGILSSEDSIARRCLQEQGVSAERVRQTLISFVGKGLSGMPPSQGLTPRARRLIETAAQECAASGGVCVGQSISCSDSCARRARWPRASCSHWGQMYADCRRLFCSAWAAPRAPVSAPRARAPRVPPPHARNPSAQKRSSNSHAA